MTTRQSADSEPPVSTRAEAASGENTSVEATTSYGMVAAGFMAKIGSGLLIESDKLSSDGVDLESIRQPLPGLKLKRASYSERSRELSLTGALDIPSMSDAEFEIKANRQGQIRVRGRVEREIEVAALGNPTIRLSFTEDGNMNGSVTIEGADITPNLPNLTATGSGQLDLIGGKLSGSGSATLVYEDLGNGTINFNFGENGVFTGDGSLKISPPFAEEINVDVSVDNEQNFAAQTSISTGDLSTVIPGLTFSAGTINLGYLNGTPTGSFDSFTADFNGLATVTISSASISDEGKFSGSGSLDLNVPMLSEASGELSIVNGNPSGSLTIGAEQFPDGLPIDSGRITASIGETGQIGLAGSLNVNLGPGGTGHLEASYTEAGEFSIGAAVDLTVPGLGVANVALSYANGDVTGEATLPINEGVIPGLGGDVTVRFEDGRWSGETALSFEADNGKLSGTILVTVAQNEENDLELGGSGSLTAQLMPGLEGTLEATILPEGGMDVSGAIEVTEPVELFPEERLDKELFKHSQNIPLWAILVAVIRIRAGVRAGIGPGVFRNIKVEGSYTIGQDEAEPSFSISGELFIPAFVEGYVAFGAGLGLDVLLGSLTGGIEGVATAGIYGAISVIPTLSYANGDWTIDGVATMAAGARLKLGLNAWAEIEALWVTVWSKEWALAEYTMPIGPDLGMQATMSYTFGQPQAPEITMNTGDIDTDSLIQDAMPKDGPAPSGARDALQNHAEWKGQLQEQREAAVPPEMQAQANQTEAPPQAPGQPSGNPVGASTGGAQATGEGANVDPGANPSVANADARSQAVDDAAKTDTSVQGAVPESEVLDSQSPRYAGPITLAMLDDPPATTPRTADQQREDLNAALEALKLASRESSDSDALDNYFSRIKSRFALASLGYEGDFTKGFKVVGRINPLIELAPNEAIRGTGIPSDQSNKHISKIVYTPGQLGSSGHRVGAKMEATVLGPDHPQGGPPKSQGWMTDEMPMAGKGVSANVGYVRGHLLNDNLGGVGEEQNLFPITTAANSAHERSIESYVKRWVNDERFWVRYSVEIKSVSEKPYGNKKSVDATIEANACVLDTELEPVSTLSRSVQIVSKFEGEPIAVDHMDETEEIDAIKAHRQAHGREIDHDLEVQLSSRHRSHAPLTFERSRRDFLNAKITSLGQDIVKSKIRGIRGIGEARINTLLLALSQDADQPALSGNHIRNFRALMNNWAAIRASLE